MSLRGLETLRAGSYGVEVMLAQSLVNSIRARNCPPDSRYRLLVDGKFGPATERAIEGLQTEWSYFVADGVVGRLTWRMLLLRGGGLCR